MAIKYIIIFQSESLQNLPKLGFLVWRQTIWHTLIVSCPLSHWKKGKKFSFEQMFFTNVFQPQDDLLRHRFQWNSSHQVSFTSRHT
jgi:hypothetical protein